MTYYIRIPQELVNNDFYSIVSEKCSEQRLEKAMSFKRLSDRIISCTAFVLLRYALSEKYGYDKMPYFYFNSHGKPLLTSCSVQFSLSHSGEFAAVSVSDSAIGADIQQDITNEYDIAEMICSPREKALLDGGTDLTRIWAVKESFFKCIGTGLPERLETYDVCISAADSFTSEGKVFTITRLNNAYLSVCSDKKTGICELSPQELMKYCRR